MINKTHLQKNALPATSRWAGILMLSLLLICAILAAAYFAFISGYLMRHPSFENFPIQGIDVSHHQGDINWEFVAADPRGGAVSLPAAAELIQ